MSGNRSERRSLSDLLAERHGSEPAGSAEAFQAPSPEEDTAAQAPSPENRPPATPRPGSMAARLAAARQAQQERRKQRDQRQQRDRAEKAGAPTTPVDAEPANPGVNGVAQESPAAPHDDVPVRPRPESAATRLAAARRARQARREAARARDQVRQEAPDRQESQDRQTQAPAPQDPAAQPPALQPPAPQRPGPRPAASSTPTGTTEPAPAPEPAAAPATPVAASTSPAATPTAAASPSPAASEPRGEAPVRPAPVPTPPPATPPPATPPPAAPPSAVPTAPPVPTPPVRKPVAEPPRSTPPAPKPVAPQAPRPQPAASKPVARKPKPEAAKAAAPKQAASQAAAPMSAAAKAPAPKSAAPKTPAPKPKPAPSPPPAAAMQPAPVQPAPAQPTPPSAKRRPTSRPAAPAPAATSSPSPAVAARSADAAPAGQPARSTDLPNFGVVLTVVALIAAAVLPLLAVGAASSASLSEAGYVLRAFAVSEFPDALASTSLADRLLGAYASATGAFTTDGSPVLAGRVPMLLVAAVGVALVYLLARHLTRSRITAVVAAVLFGLSPLSITLHRTVDPANLAIPCVLAAILLAASAARTTVTPRGRLLLVGLGAVLAVLGMLIAPILLVVAPTFAWFAWEALRPRARDRVVDAVAPVAMAVGWLVTYLLVRSGVGSTGLGSGDENISLDVLIGPDPVFVVLSILTALGALLLGRLRIVSATLLVLVLLCFFPGSASRVSAAIAALPFAALVIPSAVEATWVHWREVTSEESARLRRLGPAIVVGLLVVLALPIWLIRLGPEVAARSDGDPARAVAAFLDSEVADDEAVLVDDATWVVLARGGEDDLIARMPYDAVRSGGSFVRSGLDPSLAVAAEGVRDDRLRDLLDRSRPLAAFGPLVVRQVTQSATQNRPSSQPTPSPSETPLLSPEQERADPLPAEELAERRAAGADLLRNSKLIAEPPAAAALEQGQVDPRLLSVLVSAIFSQTIRVADFPAARGEEGTDAARRTAVITAIDGAPVDPNGEATDRLVRFLEAQLPTYRPADVSVSLTGSSLTIRYDAPSPVGLLARGT